MVVRLFRIVREEEQRALGEKSYFYLKDCAGGGSILILLNDKDPAAPDDSK